MSISMAINILQEALLTALKVPGPVLLGVLIVGLMISIFQAVTQIHEMTLVFIPKIFLTYALLYLIGNWMLFTLVNFGYRLFSSIPQMVR